MNIKPAYFPLPSAEILPPTVVLDLYVVANGTATFAPALRKKELFSLYLMPASPTREKVLKLSFVLLTEVVVVLDPMAKEKPPKNSALISLLIFIEYPP